METQPGKERPLSLLKCAGHHQAQEGFAGQEGETVISTAFLFILPSPGPWASLCSEFPDYHKAPLWRSSLCARWSFQGNGKRTIPKLLCMSPQWHFLPRCQTGLLGVSRQDQAGCLAACPSSVHQVILPPDLRKNPLSEEKEAPLPGVGICVQNPVILCIPYLLQCGVPHLPLSCTREEECPQILPSFLHGTVLYSEPSKALHWNVFYSGKRNSNRSAWAGCP